ncbi:hypothetical protein VTL71DRAFT_3006 [Oculimacula yallundae]|uniref:Uncharacterized protein n=1 Tax=Oculimacula yallundae TaxID=86028 RepID=A0ABR4C6R7_9HELO
MEKRKEVRGPTAENPGQMGDKVFCKEGLWQGIVRREDTSKAIEKKDGACF